MQYVSEVVGKDSLYFTSNFPTCSCYNYNLQPSHIEAENFPPHSSLHPPTPSWTPLLLLYTTMPTLMPVFNSKCGPKHYSNVHLLLITPFLPEVTTSIINKPNKLLDNCSSWTTSPIYYSSLQLFYMFISFSTAVSRLTSSWKKKLSIQHTL